MVAHHPERDCVAVLFLGDHHTVAHIHPSRVGGRHPQLAGPFPQRLVTLARAARVAELDVVAGHLQKRVEVTCVQRVVPGENGRELRSRHERKTYATHNDVRASHPSQTVVSPKTSIPPSAVVCLRTMASSSA